MEQQSPDEKSETVASGGDATPGVVAPSPTEGHDDAPGLTLPEEARLLQAYLDRPREVWEQELLKEQLPFYGGMEKSEPPPRSDQSTPPDPATGANAEAGPPPPPQPQRSALPDAPDHLRALLQEADRVADPIRRLISSVRARADYLADHPQARGERHHRTMMRQLGEQVRADLANCLACRFEPLAGYLGWSAEQATGLHLSLEHFAPAGDDGGDGDYLQDRRWSHQLEDAVFKPVEDLRRAILERLARPAVAADSADPNAYVLVVTVDGDSWKVAFGTRSRRTEIPVDHEAAIFLDEVHRRQGKPVSCQTINEKYKEYNLDLRANRIREKIPKELRPCFVTKAGSGTHFDKDALAEICQKLCFD